MNPKKNAFWKQFYISHHMIRRETQQTDTSDWCREGTIINNSDLKQPNRGGFEVQNI